ncbi:MAG: hypothetical protein K2W93_02590, partial [Burkholderiaceae bacterium]|nr:hypothetical protein [Burkholderiaceae bacterium]
MVHTHLKLSALALAMGMAMAAQAGTGAALAGQSDAITRLSTNTGRAPQVSFHSATGAARFVR